MLQIMKYIVLKDYQLWKEGDIIENFEVGTTPEAIEEFVAEGIIEEYVTPIESTITVTSVAPVEPSAPVELVEPVMPIAPVEAVEKKLIYMGKEVISDAFRTVNEKEMHHIKTADGVSHDLTDAEYESLISA